MPGGRPTIRELARLSGLSVGTVSKALNGYPHVHADTRERVLRLADELDYTPSSAARSLITARSHVIGVFLETGRGHPDLQHPFFHGVLVGLKECIGAAGFDLLLFASEKPGGGFGPHSYLKRCRHHRVDGTVIFGVRAEDPELERLLRGGIACVGVDLELHGERCAFVTSDNVEGAALAVQHLAQSEHRAIATIAGPLDTKPGRDRLTGYREEVQRQGLAYRDDYVAYGDFYVESGEEGMRRLLALPEPPSAVFAASDLMAVGAMRAASAAGLTIPDDISVIGFDDTFMAEHTNPPLTTLRQDKQGLGAAAGRAVVQRIEEVEDPPREITLPVELVVRASTGPVPGAS